MLTAVALIAAGLIGLAVVVPPTHSLTFDSATIAPEVGRAYVAPAPFEAGQLFQLDADRPETPDASRLKLFENGSPLGPAHSQHATIRTAAGGAFSHWGDHVLFSASDGSDPRINGRRYTADAPLTLRTPWKVLGLLLASFAVFLNLQLLFTQLRSFADASPRWLDRFGPVSGGGAAVRALLLVTVASWAVALFVLVLARSAPPVSLQIDLAEVRFEQGFAFAVPLRTSETVFYELKSDSAGDPTAADVHLFENGFPLGPNHAHHDDIRTVGQGRYSFWDGVLRFSSSDNADPRSSGRAYRVIGRLSLKKSVAATGWLLLIIACFGVAALFYRNRKSALEAVTSRLFGLGGDATTWPLSPRGAARVFLGAAALGAVVVLAGWYFGETTMSGAELARFFPISDAAGYYGCASSIAAVGNVNEFHPAWCSRRILYPAYLSTLLGITGWSSIFVLIIQGVVISLSVTALALQLSRLCGAVAAVFATAGLFIFAWEYALGLFMTEALGLSLGLCALVLLIQYAETGKTALAFGGAAALSMALTCRAGAMFALPTLLVWLWWRGRTDTRRKTAFVAGLVGVSVGPLSQVAIVNLLGFAATNSGGNFAPTLYGLSTGSRQWGDAYRDFAPMLAEGESAEAFAVIYGAAWNNILEHPDVFLRALAQASAVYFDSLFDFVLISGVRETLSILTVIGLTLAVVRVRSIGWASLLVALAIGEVLSAPLIVDSGGTRVFAATLGLRFCMITLGAHAVFLGINKLLARRAQTHTALPHGAPEASLASTIVLSIAVLVVLPATPISAIWKLTALKPIGCPIGQEEVISTIDQAFQSIRLVSSPAKIVRIYPFTVGTGRFTSDGRLLGSALGLETLALPAPITLVRAVDVASGSKHRIISLAFQGTLGVTSGTVSFCYQPGSYLEFGAIKYYFVQSMTPVK